MAQVLRYGIRHNFGVISILVVSTGEFCEKISEGLLGCNSAKKQRIIVHNCESIREVISKYRNLHVDFIVFGVDSRITRCLEEVENNIFLVDRSFVLYGHTCLVNGNKISSNVMGVTTDRILEICSKYNLRLLNADIFNPEAGLNLGERIVTLASGILGVKSGSPSLSTQFQYQQTFRSDEFME